MSVKRPPRSELIGDPLENFPPLVLRAQDIARRISFPLSSAESTGTGAGCYPGVGRFLAMLAAGCTGSCCHRIRHFAIMTPNGTFSSRTRGCFPSKSCYPTCVIPCSSELGRRK
jgi:hypothetical protein